MRIKADRLKGALGRAGHFGHMTLEVDGPRDICGMPGSIEVTMGNCTIEQRTGAGGPRSTRPSTSVSRALSEVVGSS